MQICYVVLKKDQIQTRMEVHSGRKGCFFKSIVTDTATNKRTGVSGEFTSQAAAEETFYTALGKLVYHGWAIVRTQLKGV